ncbi:hypothetical protein MPDQ_005502 [Monascus purpureus]|uniref:Intradiol ring-cleavage dioxygenases domain-containing protein n=1 Tax=Monascus purpureus TaxID=5098 RepID=A0A507R3B2_MONPU|nr:hypothetical protein MPDQ_005502 [Monascus purpureus]
MDPSQVKIPPMKDLTVDNITENVIRINSLCQDARLKYILERLVTHLHDFARETRLSTAEWMAGLQFLTEVGQICSDVRQEFILLSDILGLSILVDSMDHPKPPNSTEGTVLGPFHAHNPPNLEQGETISHDEQGEPLLVLCTLRDTQGKPIANAKIDIWETDSTGHYDVQYADRGLDGRCIMRSASDGTFWFKAIMPVSYPIPHDGPVGKLLQRVGRHPALYIRNDPYETSDAVFGVKDSLVVDISRADAEIAKKYNVPEGHAALKYDFVLISDQETKSLREKKAVEALDKLGRKVKIVNGLPVPDLD